MKSSIIHPIQFQSFKLKYIYLKLKADIYKANLLENCLNHVFDFDLYLVYLYNQILKTSSPNPPIPHILATTINEAILQVLMSRWMVWSNL